MSETFYAIANGKNQLLAADYRIGPATRMSTHNENPIWLNEYEEGDVEYERDRLAKYCVLYVDYEIHAEEIIKEENLSDARIIPCYDSDGRGSVHHIFEQEK